MPLESSTEEGQAAPGVTPDAGQEQAQDANLAADPSSAAPSAGEEGAGSDAKDPESTLDIINRVSKSRNQDEPSSGSKSGQEEDSEANPSEAKDTAEAAEAKDGDTEEDDSKLPFHKHPRWQEVKGQLKTAREQLSKVEGERDEFKASHESFQQLQGFMTKADLNVDEVNTGFEIMRMMKQDPAGALAALAPYVDQLRQLQGETLPPDIQKQVDEGFIDEALAHEWAKDRAGKARIESQQVQQTQRHQQQEQAAVTGQINAAIQAVEQWDQRWQSSDPDYSKKAPFVVQAIQAAVQQRGGRVNAQEAVQIAEQAKKQVEDQLKAFAPKPQRRHQEPVIPGGGAAKNALPEPKSTLDIINRVVGA